MTDIENLYKRYAGDVRRFALYLCGDVMMADEITSDTFVRAWMAADRIRQPTVKSYLFTIARNIYTDLLRRAARQTQINENMPDTRISAQTQMEQSAEVRAVLAALQQLPEMDRAVLLMRTRARPEKQVLTLEERWQSVRGAFATRPGIQVDNLRVLLVDDVLTTGATLDACARALREAGAKSVIGLTVARAIRNPLPDAREW